MVLSRPGREQDDILALIIESAWHVFFAESGEDRFALASRETVAGLYFFR